MLTFQNLYDTYSTITKDSTAANVTQGKLFINDTQKQVCAMGDWTFLDDEWYCASVASQEAYRLPHNCARLVSVYVLNGTTKYIPIEVPSIEEFSRLSAVSSTSSYPQYYTIYGDYIRFYPLPSSTSWNIYLQYKKIVPELSAADYSTGTISITTNTRTVTGSGTTFTSSMVGRYLKTSDGLWYEISAFSSTTSITLAKTYEGTTISGATYTIGEVPTIPDGFQTILLYPALEHYFMTKGEEQRAGVYKNLYETNLLMLKTRYQSRTTSQAIKRLGDFRNPNDYPTGLTE
jgi:hypothetical protein